MTDVINSLVGPLGVVILLLILVYAFIKQWFVTGPQYKEMKEDRDMWRDRALKLGDISARSVHVAEHVVEGAAEDESVQKKDRQGS